MNIKRWIPVAVAIPIAAALVALAGTSCNTSGLERDTSPIALIVTNTTTINTIDVLGGTGCDKNTGTINLQTIVKNPTTITDVPINSSFNDVRITRYRVSYQRTDGGTLVPASYVNSIDILLTANGTGTGTFVVFRTDAFSQAPLAALISGSGRDPETNRPVVNMDVIVEVFGQTLAGENVSGSTRFPLTFCANCGGCK
ncbi:MAG: hypothetical protein ACXVH7_00355 [Thermoanaerobaculia bacterium]